MKRYKIAITSKAQRQIDEQVFYIAKDSAKNALAWEARVNAMVDKIVNGPGHAIDAGASRRAGQTLRKCTFENTYLIFHHVDEAADFIYVTAFRHGMREPGSDEP